MFGYGRMWAMFKSRKTCQEQRKRNRLNTVMLSCQMGQVVNLSLTGMRVRSRTLLPDMSKPILVQLRFDDQNLTVPARLVWNSKTGFGSHDVGFEFVDLSDAQRAGIVQFARFASDCEILRPRDHKAA